MIEAGEHATAVLDEQLHFARDIQTREYRQHRKTNSLVVLFTAANLICTLIFASLILSANDSTQRNLVLARTSANAQDAVLQQIVNGQTQMLTVLEQLVAAQLHVTVPKAATSAAVKKPVAAKATLADSRVVPPPIQPGGPILPATPQKVNPGGPSNPAPTTTTTTVPATTTTVPTLNPGGPIVPAAPQQLEPGAPNKPAQLPTTTTTDPTAVPVPPTWGPSPILLPPTTGGGGLNN